jgi:tetratricopeptide (TPR) repeat protein
MTIARRAAAAALLAALALVAGAAPAWAQTAAKTTATAHLVRGSKLYEQGRFDEAIAELRAGYAIEPRSDFLYALGQAERKRGDCKAAIGWYQRYVDSGPSAQRTVATLVQIDRCKQELAASAPPPAVTPPPLPPPSAPPVTATNEPSVLAAPATPARDSAPRSTTPIYKRWWLWTAVAVVVAGGVGVGVGVALSQRSSFDSTLPDLSWGKSALGARF